MQKYPPPLIPPRGEVNAADAFDIGSFDEEDTKGYKVARTSHGAPERRRVAKSSAAIDFPGARRRRRRRGERSRGIFIKSRRVCSPGNVNLPRRRFDAS